MIASQVKRKSLIRGAMSSVVGLSALVEKTMATMDQGELKKALNDFGKNTELLSKQASAVTQSFSAMSALPAESRHMQEAKTSLDASMQKEADSFALELPSATTHVPNTTVTTRQEKVKVPVAVGESSTQRTAKEDDDYSDLETKFAALKASFNKQDKNT